MLDEGLPGVVADGEEVDDGVVVGGQEQRGLRWGEGGKVRGIRGWVGVVAWWVWYVLVRCWLLLPGACEDDDVPGGHHGHQRDMMRDTRTHRMAAPVTARSSSAMARQAPSGLTSGPTTAPTAGATHQVVVLPLLAALELDAVLLAPVGVLGHALAGEAREEEAAGDAHEGKADDLQGRGWGVGVGVSQSYIQVVVSWPTVAGALAFGQPCGMQRCTGMAGAHKG